LEIYRKKIKPYYQEISRRLPVARVMIIIMKAIAKLIGWKKFLAVGRLRKAKANMEEKIYSRRGNYIPRVSPR
jgi:hypothetical protein